MIKENISLVKVGVQDLEDMQVLAKQTFVEAFGPVNTEANIRLYLEIGFSDKKLRQELSNPESHFYFAKLDGRPVGYLKVNFGAAQSEINDPASLEIERIYVLKEFQGQRLGQLLLEKSLEIAREKGMAYVWLGVWEENKGAIRFYERHGFEIFGSHPFMLGEDLQTDILMRRQLDR